MALTVLRLNQKFMKHRLSRKKEIKSMRIHPSIHKPYKTGHENQLSQRVDGTGREP